MRRILLALTFFSGLGVASAQEEAAPSVKIVRGPNGERVYILPGSVLEGRRHKPSAFYVLQRSNIDYDWTTLEQGFVSKILQATQKHPF